MHVCVCEHEHHIIYTGRGHDFFHFHYGWLARWLLLAMSLKFIAHFFLLQMNSRSTPQKKNERKIMKKQNQLKKFSEIFLMHAKIAIPIAFVPNKWKCAMHSSSNSCKNTKMNHEMFQCLEYLKKNINEIQFLLTSKMFYVKKSGFWCASNKRCQNNVHENYADGYYLKMIQNFWSWSKTCIWHSKWSFL